MKAVLIGGLVTPLFAFLVEMAIVGGDPLQHVPAFIALPIAMLVTIFSLFALAFPLTLFIDNGSPERAYAALISCLTVGFAIALFLFGQGGLRILGLHTIGGTFAYCLSYWLLRTRIEQNA